MAAIYIHHPRLSVKGLTRSCSQVVSRISHLTLGAVMIAAPVYGSSGPLGAEALLPLLAVFPILAAILMPIKQDKQVKKPNIRRARYL